VTYKSIVLSDDPSVDVAPKSPTKDAGTDPVVEPDFINTEILKEFNIIVILPP